MVKCFWLAESVYTAATAVKLTLSAQSQTHFQWVYDSAKVACSPKPVCDIHGQDLKVQLGCRECLSWEPQNSFSAFCRRCDPFGFIGLCTGTVCSWVWSSWRSCSSKSETLVLCWKRVNCSLRAWGGGGVAAWSNLTTLKSCYRWRENGAWDAQADCCSVSSNVGVSVVKRKTELIGNSLNLPAGQPSSTVYSQALGFDWNNEVIDTTGQNKFPHEAQRGWGARSSRGS